MAGTPDRGMRGHAGVAALFRRVRDHAGMADWHLNPHLRKYLRLAARDLAQHDQDFQRLRSVFAVIPFGLAERTLATRAL